MATSEDRQHAEKLLYTHQRRLRLLEERRARQGDSADASLDMEIEDERRDVAVLEALVLPKPSADVQESVRRNTEGDFDFTMLFLQGVEQNKRITKVENSVEEIKAQQSREIQRDLQWQDLPGKVEKLVKDTQVGVWGRRRNFWLLALTLASALIAVITLVGRIFFRWW